MKHAVIDAHIHLDLYRETERAQILNCLTDCHIKQLISVSNDLESFQHNLLYHQVDERVKPAIGYHPEQSLPSKQEQHKLLQAIDDHHAKVVAIGEVGLPYYWASSDKDFKIAPYIVLLEQFMKKASLWDKPISLHIVYEHTDIALHLLDQYQIRYAHFHWFKADERRLEQVIQRGYYISFTPDILYRKKRQFLIEQTPLRQMMVETDGPWPFDIREATSFTHPKLLHKVIYKIAEVKHLPVEVVYATIYENTKRFFRL